MDRRIRKYGKYMPSTIKGFFSGVLGIGSLFTFLFQELVGLVLSSTVWLCAGVYSLLTAGARGVFTFSQRESVSKKGRTDCAIVIAVIMLFADISFCVLTNLRSLNFKIVHLPWFGFLILSIFGAARFFKFLRQLFRIVRRKESSFFAYKIVSVSGMLKNLVLIQRLILSCLPFSDERIWQVNSTFGYFIGAVLILLALWLLVRSIKERVKL